VSSAAPSPPSVVYALRLGASGRDEGTFVGERRREVKDPTKALTFATPEEARAFVEASGFYRDARLYEQDGEDSFIADPYVRVVRLRLPPS
jgi:hypothetical protein